MNLHRDTVDRAEDPPAPMFLQPRPTAAADAAWAALDVSRRRLMAAVIAHDGLGTGGFVAPHPMFGPLDGYQWIAFVGSHEARQAEQIEEIAATLDGAG